MRRGVAVETIIADKMTLWLDDIKNVDLATAIVEKARTAARVREASRKAKDLARKKNSLDVAQLVGKLSSCTGRNAAESELFIVEGDSAGGSAQAGSGTRRTQAILPLRGKPLNAEKKRLEEVLANEEFRSIITAPGDGHRRGLQHQKSEIRQGHHPFGTRIRTAGTSARSF